MTRAERGSCKGFVIQRKPTIRNPRPTVKQITTHHQYIPGCLLIVASAMSGGMAVTHNVPGSKKQAEHQHDRKP